MCPKVLKLSFEVSECKPLPPGSPVVVIATAHPSKFGHTVRTALGMDQSGGNGGSGDLPGAARHPSVEAARGLFHRRRECSLG
jgi:threonine synthase